MRGVYKGGGGISRSGKKCAKALGVKVRSKEERGKFLLLLGSGVEVR